MHYLLIFLETFTNIIERCNGLHRKALTNNSNITLSVEVSEAVICDPVSLDIV